MREQRHALRGGEGSGEYSDSEAKTSVSEGSLAIWTGLGAYDSPPLAFGVCLDSVGGELLGNDGLNPFFLRSSVQTA